MVLATYNKGRMVFHVVAVFDVIDVFQGTFNSDKQNFTAEKVKKFLRTDK